MLADQQKNSIITSFNRNFAKRNDGNPNTHAFVASPEIVTAFALAGRLDFNPLKDALINDDGDKVYLKEPDGIELPPRGFEVIENGYKAPAEDGSNQEIIINPNSERLQIIPPFEKWDGNDFIGLKLLIKVKGKCTTDHISMAGPWLRYRGHLDNISNNTLIGAVNFFNDKTNCVKIKLLVSTMKFQKFNGIINRSGLVLLLLVMKIMVKVLPANTLLCNQDI